VKIYRVSCASGASAQFTIPITAYYWHARLGYYRSDGSRIGFSQIVEWPRSFYGSGCKPTGAHTGKPAPTGLVVSETSDDDDAGLGVHCSLADVLETPACAEIARR
jgi:hypothetical protein